MAYGKITAKQKEILEFIKAEILRKGYPPSVREICEAVNLSLLLLFIHILRLWRKTGISEEIRPNPVRLRLWTTASRW